MLKSDIPQDESSALLNGLFKNAITDTSGNFDIKSGETLWWVNKENKQLSLDIRTVNAELDGHSIQVVFSNSYIDYNKSLDIIIPEDIKK